MCFCFLYGFNSLLPSHFWIKGGRHFILFYLIQPLGDAVHEIVKWLCLTSKVWAEDMPEMDRVRLNHKVLLLTLPSANHRRGASEILLGCSISPSTSPLSSSSSPNQDAVQLSPQRLPLACASSYHFPIPFAGWLIGVMITSYFWHAWGLRGWVLCDMMSKALVKTVAGGATLNHQRWSLTQRQEVAEGKRWRESGGKYGASVLTAPFFRLAAHKQHQDS